MSRHNLPRLPRRTALVAALGSAALLTACGAQDVPSVIPAETQAVPTPSVTPTEDPTPTPTDDPDPTTEPEPTEPEPTEPEPTEPEPTEPEPTEPEPTEPVGAAPEPPFEVGDEVTLGEHTFLVPEGWTAEFITLDDDDYELLRISNPEDHSLRFLFMDFPESPRTAELMSAGGICGYFNKPLVEGLNGDVQELGALPLSFSGDVDIVTCGALGIPDSDTKTYDYAYTVYYDLTRPKAIAMQARSDWEAYQADEIDKEITTFYICELAEQTGAVLETC